LQSDRGASKVDEKKTELPGDLWAAVKDRGRGKQQVSRRPKRGL